MSTESEPGLAGHDKALERMKQERESPGFDTSGGDATESDAQGTAARRGDKEEVGIHSIDNK